MAIDFPVTERSGDRLSERDLVPRERGPDARLETMTTVRTMPVHVPGGTLFFSMEATGMPADWVEPTLDAIARVLVLPEGWDSYGARRVHPIHAIATIEILMRLMRDNTPAPAVVPTVRGGIQLEWHRNKIDLEMELLLSGGWQVSYENKSTHEGWEGIVTNDLGRVSDIIGLVSE